LNNKTFYVSEIKTQTNGNRVQEVYLTKVGVLKPCHNNDEKGNKVFKFTFILNSSLAQGASVKTSIYWPNSTKIKMSLAQL
jgi:hypothetical protein